MSDTLRPGGIAPPPPAPLERAAGCRSAVHRCYNGLCRCGQPERYALEAAVTVFLFHNPETDPEHAETIVSHWLAGPLRH